MPFATLADREDHWLVPSPKDGGRDGSRLFLRRLATTRPSQTPAPQVLYVHGATFPSALSIAHRFDGRSWRDALCAEGFDVWGLDFAGFGHSDRPLAMDAPADANPPLGRAEDAADQLEAAVRFILRQTGCAAVSLVAHSWGTMVAGRVAGAHPNLVDRVVMFAPIARRAPSGDTLPPEGPAWRVVTLEDQWTRFTEDVPKGEAAVLSRSHFDDWGRAYLESDPLGLSRRPQAVKVPAGPTADILHAWHGDLPYDPAAIRAPVAIIRGAWDHLITDADARWLFDALAAATIKRDVKIARGTHLMHLEATRLALWRESICFLQGDDIAAMTS